MSSDARADQAAERVARAADAWLRDPRDIVVYEHLVRAVEAWRAYTRPQLDLPTGHHAPAELRSLLADVADNLQRSSRAPHEDKPA